MLQLPNTSYLLRFDDICPTMRWDTWAEIEALLIETGIKPILAVVPDNRDRVLQVQAPVSDFWDRVRRWQDLGWTIALHGYQHLYVAPAGGLVTVRKKSEFATLAADVQEEKLRRGMEIFDREGIKSRVWIAPGNAFDEVTVSLLSRFGIDIVSAGWFWHPFVGPGDMTWLPCQLSILRCAPKGIWTVCSHHNSWSRSTLMEFKDGLKRYRDHITNLEDVLAAWTPNRAPWCYKFCTSPRLSQWVLRAHLKLWKSLKLEPAASKNLSLAPASAARS
jgi:peptidoglycan/xylan/chitin deacetylase (PgdA/CDA1 family)